jgi:poly-gamma-glutamate system protein
MKAPAYRPDRGRWPRAGRTAALSGFVLAAALMMPGVFPLNAGRSLQAGAPHILEAQAVGAEAAMDRAELIIARAKARAHVPVEAGAPGAARALIGEEWTPLVTTLGSLEAKRLAVHPAWARALTIELARAGLRRGDVVAASFSGSFPGLNLAVACAVDALGARLVAVSSITASTWGANQSGFTWPEMEARLVEADALHPVSVALSPGGEKDAAEDLEPHARDIVNGILNAVAPRLGAVVLRPSSLEMAIRQRLEVYEQAAGGKPIRLYVNVGGSAPSLGSSPAILRMRPGFIEPVPFDGTPERGLIARFAERGVPVLNLLNVRDLAVRWGVQ